MRSFGNQFGNSLYSKDKNHTHNQNYNNAPQSNQNYQQQNSGNHQQYNLPMLNYLQMGGLGT